MPGHPHARKLGYATVAVYSDADRDAPHVALADEAVHIGASPAAESYLKFEAILRACRQTGADALHPGYGFLSENAAFAQACADANVVFIGPPPAPSKPWATRRWPRSACWPPACRAPGLPGRRPERRNADS